MSTRWLKKSATAELIGVTTKTLDTWAAQGYGPPRVKLGTSKQSPVRFDEDEVHAWLRQHAV